ncbi:MAG: helicase C-terminal domain-containing protein [Nanoarchaeota archaeon]|nr:helicase C-terminal domain-containing protein [Nanoarchaeota archaeon]
MEKEGSLLSFDSSGRVMLPGQEEDEEEFNSNFGRFKPDLKTSDSLEFLKQGEEESRDAGKLNSIFDNSFWSLYQGDKRLAPLKFTNGKTQEDVVRETVQLIKSGKKIVFIHGACGTGKSAIALNIARELGKASIVVPVKGLQRQYEEDYVHKKHVLKKNGKKMKIAMITGRDNHDSIIMPGKSCADPNLPDTIKFTDKNSYLLRDYYKNNPIINSKDMPEIRDLKRISIAPANPYWSPIVSSNYDLPLKDAKKRKYLGLSGKEFTFYQRKQGCSYYDQYIAYLEADVIIFNSAKYKIEVALDRKPETEVDIIDEADEFLDNFSSQEEINLTRLYNSLKTIRSESESVGKTVDKINELIELEEKNKKAIGIDENKIFEARETYIMKIITLLNGDKELQSEIEIDEMNYANKVLEIAEEFKEILSDTYVLFSKKEDNLIASIVTTQLSGRFKDIVNKNKALVLMSGTLHGKDVLKSIFGLDDFAFVDAETSFQGQLDIFRTGKEFDCKYESFSSGRHSKKDYFKALNECLKKAEKPVLIHVNSYDDLPNSIDKQEYQLDELISKEKLYELQNEDKTGRLISLFKQGMNDRLFSTRCSRGVDFPGEQCKSIVFTKYPNPNVQGVFWKVFQKTHSAHYWTFYRDKAKREFLQRIYRGLRTKDDHVFILSPDLRVLNAVQALQRES